MEEKDRMHSDIGYMDYRTQRERVGEDIRGMASIHP